MIFLRQYLLYNIFFSNNAAITMQIDGFTNVSRKIYNRVYIFCPASKHQPKVLK